LKKRTVTPRFFVCPDCNYKMIAYKRASRMTSIGKHLKNLYCPVCKNEHNFVQVSEWDFYKRKD